MVTLRLHHLRVSGVDSALLGGDTGFLCMIFSCGFTTALPRCSTSSRKLGETRANRGLQPEIHRDACRGWCSRSRAALGSKGVSLLNLGVSPNTESLLTFLPPPLRSPKVHLSLLSCLSEALEMGYPCCLDGCNY